MTPSSVIPLRLFFFFFLAFFPRRRFQYSSPSKERFSFFFRDNAMGEGRISIPSASLLSSPVDGVGQLIAPSSVFFNAPKVTNRFSRGRAAALFWILPLRRRAVRLLRGGSGQLRAQDGRTSQEATVVMPGGVSRPWRMEANGRCGSRPRLSGQVS